jgi:hypothetical protein
VGRVRSVGVAMCTEEGGNEGSNKGWVWMSGGAQGMSGAK